MSTIISGEFSAPFRAKKSKAEKGKILLLNSVEIGRSVTYSVAFKIGNRMPCISLIKNRLQRLELIKNLQINLI